MTEPTPQTDENVSPRTADEIEAMIVPHGPNGQCSNPELCVALTELRVAERREALDPHIHPPGTTDKRCRACREAEAAEPALDVERLTRALAQYRRAGMTTCAVDHRDQYGNPAPCPDGPVNEARAIAAEYARLSTDPEPPA